MLTRIEPHPSLQEVFQSDKLIRGIRQTLRRHHQEEIWVRPFHL
jgi:hypothetical protein